MAIILERIENTNQDFLLRAINTIPYVPNKGEIILFESSCKLPKNNLTHDETLDHIKTCNDNGIIPFSRIDFDYDSKQKLFLPTNSKVISSPTNPELIIAVYNVLARGGKIHQLKFRFKDQLGYPHLK